MTVQGGPAVAGDVARFRFISPYASVLALVGVAAAARISYVLAMPVAVVFAVMFGVLLRIGTDLSSAGVTIRRVFSSRSIPWERVVGLESIEDWNFGQRLVVVCADGERVVLPAPTGKTGRFAEGGNRIAAELARRFGQ